jgi:hypothetical protein
MRERRKSKAKISGSGATVLEKWPYYDVINFLENYLQRRTTTGDVPEIVNTTEVSFTDPDETEIDNSDLGGENTSYGQNMEGGSSSKELPAGIKRGGKRQKLTAVDLDKQYLDSLKEIGKRMEESSSHSDRMFLLSLLPAMKQLSPLDNLGFRVEVQEILRPKLRRLATREVQLMTYPSTSSASPALSEYSGNSHISLVDYTSASYATDPVTVVQQTGLSM